MMLARRVRSLHRTIVGVHGFSVRGPRTTDEFEVSFYDGFRNRLKPKRPSNWELMGVAKSLFYMRWVVTPPERAGRGNRGGGYPPNRWRHSVWCGISEWWVTTPRMTSELGILFFCLLFRLHRAQCSRVSESVGHDPHEFGNRRFFFRKTVTIVSPTGGS